MSAINLIFHLFFFNVRALCRTLGMQNEYIVDRTFKLLITAGETDICINMCINDYSIRNAGVEGVI